jgi:uncharacterized membrane protein YtjA (UPF0391 family)
MAMLRWAPIFLAIALAAALLGFAGLSGQAARVAQFVFAVSLVLFLVTFVIGWQEDWGDYRAPPYG